MEEKYRENFCLGVVLSRKIQWFLCVDFNKNKYEGDSYTVSREGTRNLAVLKSTDLLKMGYRGEPNTKEFEFRNPLKFLEKIAASDRLIK